MIPKHIINKGSEKYTINSYGVPGITCKESTYENSIEDFQAGVQFAEEYLKDLAIEFAEWLRINFNNSPEEIDNYWEDLFYKVDNIKVKNYTTQKLFEIFIKEKYGTTGV